MSRDARLASVAVAEARSRRHTYDDKGKSHARLLRPGARRGDAHLGWQDPDRRCAVRRGGRARQVGHAVLPQGALAVAGAARGVDPRGVRHHAGHPVERARGDRPQGRQRRRIDRQRRSALHLRAGERDESAHRPDLLGSSAVDRRLDDRRADHPRARHPRTSGPRGVQAGDGVDRAGRRLVPDPVDRRHGLRLHQRPRGPEHRQGAARGRRRTRPCRPGVGQGAAGVAAQPGRLRTRDRDQARGDQGPRPTRRTPKRPRPVRSPRRGSTRRSSRSARCWPRRRPSSASRN